MQNTIFNFSKMVNEIPSKYNKDKHRTVESIGIPLEWLDLYPKSKNPQIPNNLLTSVKQAIETNELKALGYFYTKRGKVSEFHSKYIDILAILYQYIPVLNTPYTITSHENDIDLNIFSFTECLELHSESISEGTMETILPTVAVPSEGIIYGDNTTYTITSHENDMNTGFKALSIEKILHEDYSIFEGLAEKVITALLTPYTVKTKTHQILYRIPNPQYKEGNRKAKWMYAFDSFFATKRIPYTFVSESIERHYINVQNKKIMRMGEHRILHTEFSNWLLLTRPTKAYFTQYVHSLIGTKMKGCEVVSEAIRPKKKHKKDNRGFIYIEDLIDNASKYAYEHCKPTAFFGSDYFRHYTPYSMSNCVMRGLMQYNGKSLDQCDVASMYPVILLQEYDKNHRVNDSEHDLIMQVISASNPRDIFMQWCNDMNIKITKDEMKLENISYYNMRQSDACGMKLNAMYEQKLPGFAEFLAQLKTKTEAGHKGYWQHRFISRWLEWKESTIMDPVLTKCWDNNIFAMGIHDGIDVEHGKGELVASWIKESMHDAGYICNVTVNK